MACTVNTSSNTNTENNGTQLPVHLQRKKQDDVHITYI